MESDGLQRDIKLSGRSGEALLQRGFPSTAEETSFLKTNVALSLSCCCYVIDQSGPAAEDPTQS